MCTSKCRRLISIRNYPLFVTGCLSQNFIRPVELVRRVVHFGRSGVLVVVEVSVQDHNPIAGPVQQPLCVIATYKMKVYKVCVCVCVRVCVCVHLPLLNVSLDKGSSQSLHIFAIWW